MVSTERTPFWAQEMGIWVRSTHRSVGMLLCIHFSQERRRLGKAEEHCMEYNGTGITTSPHILLRMGGNLNILQV